MMKGTFRDIIDGVPSPLFVPVFVYSGWWRNT